MRMASTFDFRIGSSPTTQITSSMTLDSGAVVSSVALLAAWLFTESLAATVGPSAFGICPPVMAACKPKPTSDAAAIDKNVFFIGQSKRNMTFL